MSDFTTPDPAHKLLSALANPLPSPGQGKARPCLRLQDQPQSLGTRPTVRGGSQLQPWSVPCLWLARCPHTQPTKALHQPPPYLPQRLFMSFMATRNWATSKGFT